MLEDDAVVQLDDLVSSTQTLPDGTELTHYGMHRHFTDGCSVVMWGGGMKKGFCYGKTADERPCRTEEGRIEIHDLHATIFQAMGISPKLSYEIEKRPFYITHDGKGVARRELFAKA